jgi:hypothetical protein
MPEKFRPRQRIIANGRAPGDYQGQLGTILTRVPDGPEYWVQFDGHACGLVCLNSRMLEPIYSQSKDTDRIRD